MDVDTFFNHIRGNVIDLIRRELTDLNSARVQTTTWIRFIQEFEDVVEIDRVEMTFNSRMTEVHQGSDLGRIVIGMITHKNWSGLEFPVAINKTDIFKKKNDISVTVLALKGARGVRSQKVGT